MPPSIPTLTKHHMPHALYARKSSDAEDRQVQSIDDQVRACADLCRARGVTVGETVTEAMSAKAPGRPGFGRLIALVDSGEADAIVCWHLNRLFRNSVDMSAIQYRLQTGAIRAVVTPERTYYPEDNMLLFYVEAGMSNQYVLDLSKGVLRGMESKIEKGWFPHRAPEGYCNDRDTKTIGPDGERFTLMRKAWDLMLTGAYTVQEVRAELTRWGYRSRKRRGRAERPIAKTTLYASFGNPFFYGWFRHRDGLRQGKHQPMVTKEEFDRVQEILGRADHPQPQKKEWAFTGFIRCGTCGCLVTAQETVKRYKSTGRTVAYRYYHCTGNKGCRKTCVPESEIEETIRQALAECRIDGRTREWAEAALERWQAEDPERTAASAAQLRSAVNTAKKRLARLQEMREDEEIGREEFLERKKTLEAEIASAEQEIAGMATKAERTRTAVHRALSFMETAYDRFAEGGVRAKREVARTLGIRYVLTLEKLEIELHPLVAALRTIKPAETGTPNPNGTPAYGMSPVWSHEVNDIQHLLDSGNLHFPGYPPSEQGGPRTASLLP